MASSTKNVKLGVCKVFYGGVDLGLTKGGVEVEVTTETYKVEVDQYGQTAIKEQVMGRNVSARIPMAESTLENMANLMPGAALVTDGVRASATLTFGAVTTATTVTIGGQAFTFSSTTGGLYAVKIGSTVAETIENFISTVNRAGLQKLIGGVVAIQTGTLVVTIRAVDFGTAGNAVTLVAASGITASGATLIGGVNQTKARLEVTTGTGTDLLDIAQELRLHPVNNADTDFSEDFVIHRAATPGALSFAYKMDAERIFNADFSGYPHPVTGKLFAIGDPNA
jgi:hypothetical protein